MPAAPHILHADDGGGLRKLEGCFEEELLLEGVAHLHRGQVVGTFFSDVLRREGSPLDAVFACG